MSRPEHEPIGLQVHRIAKVVNRAFEQDLADAGASLPIWLILMSLKARRWGTQRELARAVSIEGPTLTHHLDGLERDGLITRERDPENRRVHRVELTEPGEAAFQRLRRVAMRYDERLRQGLSEGELEHLRELLERLGTNAAGG
jgi:MarR family transcriptional regulator for hemolysin